MINQLSQRRGESSTQTPHSQAPDESAQRDRARVIHCAAFRRLQSKTQILSIGENDFHRTRLTHSLEVAQIGSGICERLRHDKNTPQEYLPWIATLSQMEAICLAHDIGHPPFGHGGEVALNFFMHDHGGFEGNGQTLRIVSKLGEYSPQCGLDLTRRTMLGLLKYPVPHAQVAYYPRHQTNGGKQHLEPYRPPKCIHDDDNEALQWILQPLSETDKKHFQHIQQHNGNIHSKSKYKSFDTSIMELADDIAYGVHDLEDALALKLVNDKQWKTEVIPQIQGTEIFSNLTPECFNNKLFSDSNLDRKNMIGKLVSYFIQQIDIQQQETFSTPLLDLQAVMQADAQANLEVLKKFVSKYVIKTQEVKMLEYKGQQIIIKLYDAFRNNPKNLLPHSTYQKINQDTSNLQRIICDYIAGMTDNYAIKVHHKLF